jgi:hypothetical protein
LYMNKPKCETFFTQSFQPEFIRLIIGTVCSRIFLGWLAFRTVQKDSKLAVTQGYDSFGSLYIIRNLEDRASG